MSLLGLIFSSFYFQRARRRRLLKRFVEAALFVAVRPLERPVDDVILSRSAVGRWGLLFVTRSTASPDEMCERPFRRVTERRSGERRGSGERERRGRGNTRGNGLIKSWCVGRVVPRPRQHAVAHIMHVSMQTAVPKPNKPWIDQKNQSSTKINQSIKINPIVTRKLSQSKRTRGGALWEKKT